MAERNRPSASPPRRSQLTSDHPSTSQVPLSSSSTDFSAQPPLSASAAQQQHPQRHRHRQHHDRPEENDPTLSNLIPGPSTARPRPSGNVQITRPRQLLGRRTRSDSDGDEPVHYPHGLSSFPATSSHVDSPGPKRRRKGSMSADGDGEASSNGTSRGPASDSRAQQRTFRGSATNGTYKAPTAAVNGSSRQNGKQQPHAAVPTIPYFGHDREEVTRILIQALSDLGHHAAAESVSADSGYELESPTVAAFRSAVINGSWDEAEKLLFGPAEADGRDGVGNGLLLVEGADPDSMRFRIRQQKYLELLEHRDLRQALSVLRTELTPLNQDPQQLNFLSTLLMCQSAEDIKAKAHWDGAEGQSRHHLLAALSSTCAPDSPHACHV